MLNSPSFLSSSMDQIVALCKEVAALKAEKKICIGELDIQELSLRHSGGLALVEEGAKRRMEACKLRLWSIRCALEWRNHILDKAFSVPVAYFNQLRWE